MSVSTTDFASSVAAHVGAVNTNPASPTYAPTGALFRVQNNADGTLAIYRSAGTSGASGTAGGPQFPWVLAYPRVTYDYIFDRVVIGDGSGQATQSASVFISGLN